MAPFRILSIDGGGIRGIIPAVMLAEMEQKAGQPIWKMFDLIAGTSTGAILALGLVKPLMGDPRQPEFSAEDLLNLYRKEGKQIFDAPYLQMTVPGPKHSAAGIEKVLRQYFGDVRLSEAMTDVLITSYCTTRRIPFFFKSRKAKTKTAWNHMMWQAARGSSSAPTYFPVFRLDAGAPPYSLIDGGMVANNPAGCALVEARKHRAHDELLIVSLGTGTVKRTLLWKDIAQQGSIKWATDAIDILFDATASVTDFTLRQLLSRDSGQNYFRFDRDLGDDIGGLDDVTSGNIDRLLVEAGRLKQGTRKQMAEVLKRLSAAA